MKRLSLACGVLILCCGLFIACMRTSTRLPKLTVDDIIARNTAAREALAGIRSCEYDIDCEESALVKFPDQWESRTLSSHVKISGGSRFFKTPLRAEAGKAADPDAEYTAIITPAFSAIWDKHAALAYRFANITTESFTGLQGALLEKIIPPDPLYYGNRLGSRTTLLEKYQNNRVNRTWTVLEKTGSGGKPFYQLVARQANQDGGSRVELIADIDPAKNFLITHLMIYHPTGEIWTEWTATLQQVDSKFYIPREVTVTRHGAANLPSPHFGTPKQHFTVKNVILNRDIPPRDFEFAALGVPKETEVRDYPLLGLMTECIFDGNAIIPAHAFQKVGKQEVKRQ